MRTLKTINALGLAITNFIVLSPPSEIPEFVSVFAGSSHPLMDEGQGRRDCWFSGAERATLTAFNAFSFYQVECYCAFT